MKRGLAEFDAIRQPSATRYPRQAAVLGTNRLGLLATLLLRLRSIEVVTLGGAVQPLLSPHRLQGLAGWKHLWMSPALAHTQLASDIGARYVSTRELTVDEAAQRFGPFDIILLTSADCSSVLKATKGLARRGVLVDLTSGNSTLEIWAASPSPCFLVRHQVAPGTDRGGRAHCQYERVVKNLALPDVQYPGWLPRLATCSTPVGQNLDRWGPGWES